jgi:hypothetical protein
LNREAHWVRTQWAGAKNAKKNKAETIVGQFTFWVNREAVEKPYYVMGFSLFRNFNCRI